MSPMMLFYCLKRIKIASKKGTWKWQKSFTLRLKKVSWVALSPTTNSLHKSAFLKEHSPLILMIQVCV